MQSDPLGLGGGLGTYLYALANPTGAHDRFGLDSGTVAPPAAAPTAPPLGNGGDGDDGPQECFLEHVNLLSMVKDGFFFGWPPTGTFQCIYSCPPKHTCPKDHAPYYRYVTATGPVIMPGISPCPATAQLY